MQPLFYTTLYYGLHRSEVLGLKWDAIDFENDTLEIKHTVVKQTTIVAKDKTKNRSWKKKIHFTSRNKGSFAKPKKGITEKQKNIR